LARPILSMMVRETEGMIAAVAQLGVSHGTETLYLAKELPTRPVTIVTEVGVRLPAHLTASGRAILSNLDAAQLRATYSSEQTFVNRTGLGPKNLRELTRLLQIESGQGFSFESGFITEGYSSVAAAVKNHLEMPVAALALTFRSEDANERIIEKLVKILTVGAAELSKRLGAH